MKTFCLLLVGLFFINAKNTYSQDFEVPKGYTLKAAADYALYEKNIINAAKWLTTTAFNDQPEKRRQVSVFVTEWVMGSPTVYISLHPVIMDFEKKNEGMLVVYMASCARYVLENNYSKDTAAKHRAALNDMILVYKAGAGIRKDKKMEKLIKSAADNKLDEWIEVNFKIN